MSLSRPGQGLKRSSGKGSGVKTRQPWPCKPLVRLTHWAVTWLPGTCISHPSGPQRTQDQSYRPALTLHVCPGRLLRASWYVCDMHRPGGAFAAVMSMFTSCVTAVTLGQAHPLGSAGTKKDGLLALSCMMSSLLSSCRQTEEPLPAKAAHPARAPPRWRTARHLMAPGRQGSGCPWGLGAARGVSGPESASQRAASFPQVSMSSRQPAPHPVQHRPERRLCMRSPQCRTPSTRSPPW